MITITTITNANHLTEARGLKKLFIGSAPLPLHNTDSNNVAIPDSCYIMQQNNTGNVSVNITVQNHGLYSFTVKFSGPIVLLICILLSGFRKYTETVLLTLLIPV